MNTEEFIARLERLKAAYLTTLDHEFYDEWWGTPRSFAECELDSFLLWVKENGDKYP